MSIQTDIRDQFKDIIEIYVPKMSNRIFTRQNIDELLPIGKDFIRLSFAPSVPDPASVALQVRVTRLQIDYYHKSGNHAEIENPNEIKDLIMQNIPRTNRPYWYIAECDGNDDEPEFNEKITAEDYEGFQLTYEIRTSETITCKAPTLMEDIDEGLLTESGDYIVE